jgi:GNAT superfamily N-acetyltransferase
MFQVKIMRSEDFAFAVELANTMNWNMATEDFEFMLKLEPEGCFVLFDDSKPVGIATCIAYGEVGWFGNLIVKEEYRHKGAGSFLVKYAIDYLHSKGVETIGLYAYPNLTKFYGDHGFKADETFTVLQAQIQKRPGKEELTQIERNNIQAITKFDRECFGGDRKKLLESIILEEDNLSYCLSKDKDMMGYLAGTVYEHMAWIGPLICRGDNSEAAVSLLNAALEKLAGKTVYLALSKKETSIVNILFSMGFKKDFDVIRMFFGPRVAKNCIYLAESLERG